MNSERIAYLGPQGTFCEIAARRAFPHGLLIPYPNFLSVIEAVASGSLPQGVLPLENFLEGTVTQVLDGLTCRPQVKIAGEILIPIRHHLLAVRGMNLKQLTAVFSHSHALAQCQKFLQEKLGSIPCYPVSSTAEAARRVSLELHSCAAVGNDRAASIYGLKILAKDIGDIPENYTLFIVIALKTPPPTGKDKTSIVFSLEHRPGSLSDLLNLFSQKGINLTKIESRPSRKIMGEYIFYVDFEGHEADNKVKDMLKDARSRTASITVMGSYPQIT